MRLLAVARAAFVALRLNALRTALAMIGVIIGVGSVVVMVSTGNGARIRIDEQVAALGTNILQVVPGSFPAAGVSGGVGTAGPFNTDDVSAIAAQVSGIDAISAVVSGPSLNVLHADQNWTTQIYGVDAGYFDVRDWALTDGRVFTDNEAQSAAKVALLGKTVADNLVPDNGDSVSPIGQTVRIRGIPFEVIGLLSGRGADAAGDQDDVILVPASTARRRIFGSPRTVPNVVRSIFLKVDDVNAEPEVQADIESLLRERRHALPGRDNFKVQNPTDFVRARSDTQSTLGLLLGATAVVALIVGGVGIMNIMLVSVTERTREIGLRMAVGAKNRDILGQFLVEAVTLCAAGGLIGIGLGVAATVIIARLDAWAVSLDPSVIVVAIASSAVVGVFFGFYPARIASRLNPIEALRHE